MSEISRAALLLVNLGTPAAPTRGAVKRYLAQFLHDHRVVDLTRWLWCPILHFIILPLRSGKVAKKYAAIWMPEGSPLRVHSERLSAKVQALMPQRSVHLAMTYGEPSVPETLRALQAAGIEHITVLPLYPQYSATTSEAVFDAVQRTQLISAPPRITKIADYHTHPDWVQAVADSIRAHWQAHGRAQKLLMSFHGIPQRYARNGDPYPQQCEASAAAIAQELGLSAQQWLLTYQSRFGREPWLAPYTDRSLQALAQQGVRSVEVVCPGFAVDCLETLEEIAVENAALFRAAGGDSLHYIPCLNDSDAHAQALLRVVMEAEAQ